MFVVETILPSQFAWVSVFSSSNLSLKRCLCKLLEIKHCMLCILVCTIESHCIFYCSLLKSIDLINLENVCEYFAVKLLLLVGQVPPLDFI